MSRLRGGTLLTTRSPMRRTPSVMSSSPATMRSAVVFPQPEGPTSTISSPSSISRSIPATARVPSGYTLATRSKVTPANLSSPVNRPGRRRPAPGNPFRGGRSPGARAGNPRQARAAAPSGGCRAIRRAGSGEAHGGPGAGLRRLDLPVLRRRGGREAGQQCLRGRGHGGDRTVERLLVRPRGLREPADLPDVLERGGVDLLLARRRLVVVEGADVAAHGPAPFSSRSPDCVARRGGAARRPRRSPVRALLLVLDCDGGRGLDAALCPVP